MPEKPRRFRMEWGQGDGAGYVIRDWGKEGHPIVFKSDSRSDTEQKADELNEGAPNA